MCDFPQENVHNPRHFRHHYKLQGPVQKRHICHYQTKGAIHTNRGQSETKLVLFSVIFITTHCKIYNKALKRIKTCLITVASLCIRLRVVHMVRLRLCEIYSCRCNHTTWTLILDPIQQKSQSQSHFINSPSRNVSWRWCAISNVCYKEIGS